MPRTLPTDDVAAQVAHLSADIDALDAGLVDVGVTASEALALAQGLQTTLDVALQAAGLDEETRSGTASFADPVVSRLEAKRQRRAEAHRRFTVIAGGAS